MDFIVPADHWMKIKESEKIDRYLDLARELNPPPQPLQNKKTNNKKQTVDYEGDVDTNYNWCAWNGSQGFVKIN